jgi:hypothetical protein
MMKKIGCLVIMLVMHGTIFNMMLGRKLRNCGNITKLSRSHNCLPAWPESELPCARQATKKDFSADVVQSLKDAEMKRDKLLRDLRFASIYGFDPNETVPVVIE